MTPRYSCAAGLVMTAFTMGSFNTVFAQSTAPGAIVLTEEVTVQGRLMPEEEVAERPWTPSAAQRTSSRPAI